jgi:hypothetical protein
VAPIPTWFVCSQSSRSLSAPEQRMKNDLNMIDYFLMIVYKFNAKNESWYKYLICFDYDSFIK